MFDFTRKNFGLPISFVPHRGYMKFGEIWQLEVSKDIESVNVEKSIELTNNIAKEF